MDFLQQRLLSVRQEIAAACSTANRSIDEVTLITVTKNHPTQLVLDLLELGQFDFGENRNQEAEPKAAEVLANSNFSRSSYRWHFIGQLQSNKVKNVLEYADVLHSLDRESLLESLAKELPKKQRNLEVFIQLNLTDNAERGGIRPADLLPFAEKVLQVPQLKLQGVMGVASLDGNLETDFDAIWRASQQLRTLHPSATSISAGMSDDFEIALRHGATHLRIGTAITGKRQY